MTPSDLLIAALEELSRAAYAVGWADDHEREVWRRLAAWRAGEAHAYGDVDVFAMSEEWLPRIGALAAEAGVWPVLDEDGDELYRLVTLADWERELAEEAEAEDAAEQAAHDAAGVPPPPKYVPDPLPELPADAPLCVSLFAGVGGIDLGFHQAGIRTVVQVEWDKAASKVLAARFPDAVRFGDVRSVSGQQVEQYLADAVRRAGRALVRIVAGGFPCQDVSVAGRRAGVAGERSNLYTELVRIADEVDPDWVVVENVAGLLTSYDRTDPDARRGDDFATVLGDLTGFRPAVPKGGWGSSGVCVGPKRSLAWRLFDARYFGVAQRRRRVFLVACPRDRAAPAAVLLEPEGVRGNPPPGAPPRPGTARATARADVRHGVPAADRRGADDDGAADIANALTANGLGGGGPDDNMAQGRHIVPAAAEDHPVAATVKRQGSLGIDEDGAPAYTMDTWGTLGVAVCPPLKDGDDARPSVIGADVYNGELTGDVAHTLRSQEQGVPRVIETPRADTIAIHVTQTPITEHELSPTLGATTAGMGVSSPAAAVRRLTPVECERLQGFPDGWTDVDGASDSPRYKQLGNAVATVCSGWIGWRIKAYIGGWRPASR